MTGKIAIDLRFAVILFIIFVSCSKKQNNPLDTIAFQEGDIVFRRGTGVKSRVVLEADPSGTYSHVGIVVLQDSNFKIAHITPGEREEDQTVDKIKIENIGDFWRKDRAVHGAIYRFKNNTLASKAANEALRLLQKGILFDHEYRLNDTTAMYCTEFVWYTYKQAGIDISFGKRTTLNIPMYSGTYILPSDIYMNNDFNLIYKF